MPERPSPHCQCPECQQPGSSPTKKLHGRMKAFLRMLDEPRRRLYAALEAKRHGPGGERWLALITGMSETDILAGQRELERQTGADQEADGESDEPSATKRPVKQVFDPRWYGRSGAPSTYGKKGHKA